MANHRMRCVLLQVSLFLATIRQLYVAGYGINENLFFSVLVPENVAFIYQIRPAKDFGAVFDHRSDRILLVPTEPEDACGELTNANSVDGEIALIKRGGCSFMSKCITAENSGAIAVVIHDDNERNDWLFIDMVDDNTKRDCSIPATYLRGRDGYMIKQSLHQNGMVGAVISIPVNVTGVPLGLLKVPPWSLW